MRALIVYESMFGNTFAIAKSIAEGLAPHMTAEVVEVGQAPTELGPEFQLIVVGGPTVFQKMRNEGVPLKIVATIVPQSDLVIITAKPEVRSLVDLKGKGVDRRSLQSVDPTHNQA
jgi:flavorubredoxin